MNKQGLGKSTVMTVLIVFVALAVPMSCLLATAFFRVAELRQANRSPVARLWVPQAT